MVSALLYGLAMDYRDFGHPETGQVLTEVEVYLRTVPIEDQNCAALVDLRLAAAFLAMSGTIVPTSDLEKRLGKCKLSARPVDLASALFLYCGFTEQDHRRRLPGALERIEAIQRPDGGFGFERGWGDFYLSSHALFALHVCRGDPGAIRRGQNYLIALLPYFRYVGFLDGLLESLVMLNKMGVVVPEYEGYLSYVMSRIQSDGGICHFDLPGCTSHWHATSLLLELLRMEDSKVRQGG